MNKHGLPNTRLYNIWRHMKRRCYNNKDKDYKYYGNLGITICEEWKINFLSFYNWSIENGYNENLTIDRININGNYEPNNCRWITIEEQNKKKRDTHFLTYNGETHNIIEWSKITGLSRHCILKRINNYKWTVEKTLTKPPKPHNFKNK